MIKLIDSNTISMIYIIKVATPTFSLISGTYEDTQNIEINSIPGANIYYTTDGSLPTKEDILYTGILKLSSSQTIKAIAIKNDMADSEVATAVYEIIPVVKIATPVFNPGEGTYETLQVVDIFCETPDVTIFYTVDGTLPTRESNLYSTPITVDKSLTLKAIAVKLETPIETIIPLDSPTFTPDGGEIN